MEKDSYYVLIIDDNGKPHPSMSGPFSNVNKMLDRVVEIITKNVKLSIHSIYFIRPGWNREVLKVVGVFPQVGEAGLRARQARIAEEINNSLKEVIEKYGKDAVIRTLSNGGMIV